MTWKPFGQPEFDPTILYDGIPQSMASSAQDWLAHEFTDDWSRAWVGDC